MHRGRALANAHATQATRDHAVNANEVRELLGAGVSCEQIEDALAVCVTFNTIDRPSRSCGWAVSNPAFAAGAKYLPANSYR
jgi:ethanolamine ammonia-lyase small subunit